MKKVIVIGSGVAGLSSAACLAKEGFDVTIIEKNSSVGGRARKFEKAGYVFDMGPSWYWMPDVFENFFGLFGKKASDYYELQRLDPSYRVFFGKGDYLDVPATIPALCQLFEQLEGGSSEKLLKFLDEGSYKYRLGMGKLVYKPGLSVRELLDLQLLTGMVKLHVFQSLSAYVRKFFRNPKIISLLEFPVLFLGAAPEKTPALYSLMNYADMALGTWYPLGGMHKIIEAMVLIAREQGVKIICNSPATGIAVNKHKAEGVWCETHFHPADFIIASADYQHVEKDLLPENSRNYSDAYWDSRVMAPSSLIFYIGVNKRVNHLLHHTLFFDQDFTRHVHEIYEEPQWPSAPQFYVSCTSKSDLSVAPPGGENLFILIPVAPGLRDDEATREKYFTGVIQRMEELTGEVITPHIVYKRSYAHRDFMNDYNAFKGNAYGLANTLLQTANFKPAITNRKISNLFYAGQLTVPGPGLPPSIISGQVAAAVLLKKAAGTL